MTIEYNLKDNYNQKYNDMQGIVLRKRTILKNASLKNITLSSFLRKYFLLGIFFFFFLLILMSFFEENSGFYHLFRYLAGCIPFVYLYYCFVFLLFYLYNKKQSNVGKIIIDSYGITDEVTNGKKIGYPWEKIEAAVITDNVIVYLLKSHFVVIYSDANRKVDVIEALKMYQPSLKIIDYQKRGNI